MYLTEEDLEMLNGSLKIFRKMYGTLRALEVTEAKADLNSLPVKMRQRYARKDKKDTIYFDIVAEDAISLGHDFYGHDALFKRAYDKSGVIITEEKGKVGSSRIEHSTPVIISDPADRSSYLEKIIEEHGSAGTTMGEVFDFERKKIGESHARVEGCNSSVTLLKDNMIKYSLILNLFTGEVFVAYPGGIFSGDIKIVDTIDDLKNEVTFKRDETLNMLCYSEGSKYENNRKGTHLRHFPQEMNIKSPGGPIRFTYLLEEGKEKVSSVGVIAHNGEKIQESLPNIAVAFFSKGKLWAYKLFCSQEFVNEHRAGKGLTPNLQNSIYNHGLLTNTGLKLEFLNNHDYPSDFRDTTVIAPASNDPAITLLEGMVRRDYAIRII
ncbi:MAG TPA: hypothetical protein VJI32_05785 [Candidatus Nanoarchaeia archaeon]|nr:hypothetical protein [Candidatus Woesearchaeota archaeon]HIG93793.1 hypothetical protein [Candidatus Woesearchaeota archaeon]HIH13054.1 hypothetical protein [Candidatus Woesearchaeota archaeon]HLC71494.1 hypothetical protein [Candidatus Nanoarchaeia archaeon]